MSYYATAECPDCGEFIFICPFFQPSDNAILFISLDVDECDDGSNLCHMNATCANTIGSYTCTCNYGTKGNGLVCKCRINLVISLNNQNIFPLPRPGKVIFGAVPRFDYLY